MTTTAALALCLALAAPPRISGRVGAAVDMDTGEILFDKAADTPHAIASVSKLMALRVVWKRGLIQNAETVMAQRDAQQTWGGARSRLVVGRSYTNRDLVRAALLGSDNRAVMALGRAVGLEGPEFARAMTAEAASMGLRSTRFVDATGIDHGNRSTGIVLAELLRATVELKDLAAVTRLSIWQTSAKERSGRPLVYRNTDQLVLGDSRQILAGKTGFNSAAGWCVAAAVSLPSGRRVAIVVLGAPSKHLRFSDWRHIEAYVRELPWVRRPAPRLPEISDRRAARGPDARR